MGKLPFYILLLVATLSLTRVAPGQSAEIPTTSEPENAPAEMVSVNDVASDSQIEIRLKEILGAAQKAGWFEAPEIETHSGIVTLRGTADSEEHRQWAQNVARKTQDVIAVVNEIEVESVVDLDSTRDVVGKSLAGLWNDFLQRSPLLIAAVFIIILTSLLARATGWAIAQALNHRKMRSSLKDLIFQLSSIGVWIVGLLIATVIAFPGMTPSKALTVLGLGSVAIGFAFKDIFENFFAGILILWRYPFDRGDFITCGDITGEVKEINIRNTMIRRLDGELAVVPNATLFKNSVDVLTSQPQRRVRLICGIAYHEDVDQSRDVISKAVQSCDSVQGKRTVQVFALEFASSSINFEVSWWTGATPVEIRRSRDEVVAKIKNAMDAAGIEIPFPYRTLTFQSPAIEAELQRVVHAGELTDEP